MYICNKRYLLLKHKILHAMIESSIETIRKKEEGIFTKSWKTPYKEFKDIS